MTTKRKPGRPPKHESGAMTTLRLRVPQWMLDYLDSKGNRSEVARDIIERARRADVEAAQREAGRREADRSDLFDVKTN